MTNLWHDDAQENEPADTTEAVTAELQGGPRFSGGASTPAAPGGDAGQIPVGDSLAWLWRQATQQVERLKRDLALERQKFQSMAQRKTQSDGQLAAQRDQLDSLQVALEKEREVRITVERELSSVQGGWKHVQGELAKLEGERRNRLKIERRLALLDNQTDKALELAAQLATERNQRVRLEREKGMLLSELRQKKELEERLLARKKAMDELQRQLMVSRSEAAKLEMALLQIARLEEMLAEERTLRLNSEMRAANATVRAARLQSELDLRRRRVETPEPESGLKRWWSWLSFR